LGWREATRARLRLRLRAYFDASVIWKGDELTPNNDSMIHCQQLTAASQWGWIILGTDTPVTILRRRR
jgi:hypothetical protein